MEKIDAKFVLKHLNDLKQNEPIRNLLIEVLFFAIYFNSNFHLQFCKSNFITKDGATEFAKYFANHNIRSLTAEGDYGSTEIRFLDLSKVRKAGVVEIIQAFADVDVENLIVVWDRLKLNQIYKIIKKKKDKNHIQRP